MAQFVAKFIGHSEAALSTAAHRYPWIPGVNWAEGMVTGLTEPDDIRLRWRVGTGWTGASRHDWLTIPGTKDAKQRDPRTWAPGLVAVRRSLLEQKLKREPERRVAVAHSLGPLTDKSVFMVGVNERQPDMPLLTPVTRAGTPAADGDMLAVGERTGKHPNIIVIGTVGEDPTNIDILPTQPLPIEAIPHGVHRI
jgi:hypothetical protein